jgi:hypothetical protein
MSVFHYYSSGELKSTLNGNVITDKAFDATYDGKHMKITGHDNKNNFSKNLNNDDIMKLISIPSHKMSLNDRLMKDFQIKSISKKTKKSKKSISKKSKKSKKSKTKK